MRWHASWLRTEERTRSGPATYDTTSKDCEHGGLAMPEINMCYYPRMTLHRLLLTVSLALVLVPSVAMAQPSKKQMRADLDAASAKSLAFEGKGKTEFDLMKRVHVFSQYATIVRKHPALAGVFIEIYGWAEYQSPNKKRWRFVDFHTASNKFAGIPNPSEGEIRDAIDKNLRAFYGNLGDRVRGAVKFTLTKDPHWEWEQPWKVTMRGLLKYERLSGATTLEQIEHPVLIELYRDANDMKGPWKTIRRKKIRLSQQEVMTLAMQARKTGKMVDPARPTITGKREVSAKELSSLPALSSNY